jgi:hypothetical protein
MADRTFEIGDNVKVIHQDIYGEIVSIDYDNHFVTIRDADDGLLLIDFDITEVELIKNRIGG